MRAASRFLQLLRIVIFCAGRAAYQRAGVFYLGIFVAAAIIFSPQGLRAATVTEYAARHISFRLILWALWLLATTPAARAVLAEPSLLGLRSLPVPRWQFLFAYAILLGLVEGPWVVLFARGAGGAMAIGAGLLAMAAHALFVARSRRPIDLLALALLFGTVASAAPIWLFLGTAVLVLPIGLGAAFREVAEKSAPRGRPLWMWTPRSALWALSMTYIRTLWRGHRALIGRALLLTLLAAAITSLATSNNHLQRPGEIQAVSLGVLTAALWLGAAGLCGPVLRSERRIDWLLTLSRVSGRTRVLAAALAIAVLTMALGGLYGLLCSWLLGGGPLLALRIGTAAIFAGCTLGAAFGCTARFLQRGDKKDGQRTFLFALGGIPIAALLAWSMQDLALLIWAALALLGGERAIFAADKNRAGRWLRLRQEDQSGERL